MVSMPAEMMRRTMEIPMETPMEIPLMDSPIPWAAPNMRAVASTLGGRVIPAMEVTIPDRRVGPTITADHRVGPVTMGDLHTMPGLTMVHNSHRGICRRQFPIIRLLTAMPFHTGR